MDWVDDDNHQYRYFLFGVAMEVEKPLPPPAVLPYVKDPDAYTKLDYESKLQVIADIILYFADMVWYTLKINGKNRVDACVDALYWKNRQEYWESRQMNLKKEVDLENTKARRGI